MTINLRSVGIHDGSFHADEVCACALLLQAGRVDRDKIIRSRSKELLDQCEYVCDVGGVYDSAQKRFDHHQADYTGPKSSAGMVLSYLEGEGDFPLEKAEFLRDSLILGVDAHDNGRCYTERGVMTFSQAVANFSPVEYGADSETWDKHFHMALDFVFGHIQRMLARYDYTSTCKDIVEKKMKEGQEVLVFEEPVPWIENFFALGGQDHPAKFVVMPAGEGWKLRGVPPSIKEKMKVRVPLPEKWAGLLGNELKVKSQIDGAVFCHKGRFISVWETKEDALVAMRRVLEGEV